MKFKYALLFSILLIFSSCSDKKDSDKNKVVKQEEIKYPITLTTSNAKSIDVNKTHDGFVFSNQKNKAVLLTFITSWCPPCKAEIPHLNNLQKTYDENLTVIAVLMEDKDLHDIHNFMKKYDINFILTHGKENFTLAKAMGDVKAIPFSILFDKNGIYATHYVGAVPEEMMNVDIQKVMK